MQTPINDTLIVRLRHTMQMHDIDRIEPKHGESVIDLPVAVVHRCDAAIGMTQNSLDQLLAAEAQPAPRSESRRFVADRVASKELRIARRS